MTDRPRHYHYASAEGDLDGLQSSPADALFIDLEDSVRAELKDAARERTQRFLSTADRGDSRVAVRINPVGSSHWRADVDACAPLTDRLIVPLVEDPEALVELDGALTELEQRHDLPPGSRRLHVLVETAAAVVHLPRLVTATPRIEGLLFGQADFTLSIGASGIAGGAFKPGPINEWTHPAIVLHARAHGLESATQVWAPAGDEQVAAMRRMYELGYDAVVVGSPAGVERANLALEPAPEDLAFARAVRETYDTAFRDGSGPAIHDGWAIEGAMARVADRTIDRSRDGR